MPALQRVPDIPYQILQTSVNTTDLTQSRVQISSEFGEHWVTGRFSGCLKQTEYDILLQDGRCSYFFNKVTQQLRLTTGPFITGKVLQKGYINVYNRAIQSSQILDTKSLSLVSSEPYVVFLPEKQIYVKKLSELLYEIEIESQKFYCQEFYFTDQGLVFKSLQQQWFLNAQVLDSFSGFIRKIHETSPEFNANIQAPFSTQLVSTKKSFPYFQTFQAMLHYCRQYPVDPIGVSTRIIDVDQPINTVQELVNTVFLQYTCRCYRSYSGNAHFVFQDADEQWKALLYLIQNGYQVDLLHQLPKYAYVFPAVFPILKKELIKATSYSAFCTLCSHLREPAEYLVNL